MLGMEVQDEVRGRTFAFVQSLIRVTLVAVLAISPLIAAGVGQHIIRYRKVQVSFNGAAITILIAGLIAALIGVISYRQMKDRPNVSLWSDIANALRGELGSITGATTKGLFIAFEGGEGSGKSTQTKLLKQWLEEQEHSVVLSREPGGTPLGKELRNILLSHSTGDISPRAEALLYAADRANHVYALIRPALEAGDIVRMSQQRLGDKERVLGVIAHHAASEDQPHPPFPFPPPGDPLPAVGPGDLYRGPHRLGTG